MGKKSRDSGVSLDSLMDILTCLLGVLMLLIISTGIDAAKTKILIPTPMEFSAENRKPVYIECRNNQLFVMPLEEIRKMVSDTMNDLAAKANRDSLEYINSIGQAKLITKDGAFEIDLVHAMAGQIAIRPVRDAKGNELPKAVVADPDSWYGRILGSMNKEKEMIVYFVRDDSYKVFKIARRMAWNSDLDVSFELFGVDEPIIFGLGGTRVRAQ